MLAALVVGASLLAGCDDVSTVVRPDEPAVLVGADLPDLMGLAPGRIVAFAHTRSGDVPVWRQIPVQVDERKVVDFGSQPGSNASAGVTGTVYGTAPIGVTALQYADPGTFVGADPNATFDADDELVVMVADAGGKVRSGEESEPAGVVAGSGVVVQLDDPLGDDDQGWVHLFESTGSLAPSAGADYVDYDFDLTSGPYATTYKRATGPNPETSVATTAAYRIGFTDRWTEDSWQITAGGATGVDVLDGVKARFALSTCGRSNKTFREAEGAFVANIDGPVRAIRSYVGANSGPLTQRTHLLYRDREVVITDLRVHDIPAIMDFIDYSAAGYGMTYSSSAYPAGVPIDGVPDPSIGTALPDWQLATGAQGSVLVTEDLESTLLTGATTLDTLANGFHLDDAATTVDQCWGDADFIGASGVSFVTPIPNTDPREVPFATFRTHRTLRFSGPGATAAEAAEWAADVRTPLTVTVTPYLVP